MSNTDDLNIKMRVDPSEVSPGFQQAIDASKSLEAALARSSDAQQQSATKSTQAIRSVTTEQRTATNAQTQAMRDKIETLQLEARTREISAGQEIAALQELVAQSEAGSRAQIMARRELASVEEAEAQAQIARSERVREQMTGDVEQIAKVFGRQGGLLKDAFFVGGATAGFIALEEAMKKTVEVASDYQSVQARLALSLRDQGAAQQQVIKSVSDFAKLQSDTTRFSELDVLQNILQLTNAGIGYADAMKIVRIAEDVASASNKDLTTSTTALMEVEHGRTTGLASMGVGTRDLIKTGTDWHTVLKKIEDQMGNQATSGATTQYSNVIATLQHAIEDAEKAIGDRFLPSMQKLTLELTKNVKAWTDDKDATKGFGENLASTLKQIGDAKKTFGDLDDILNKINMRVGDNGKWAAQFGRDWTDIIGKILIAFGKMEQAMGRAQTWIGNGGAGALLQQVGAQDVAEGQADLYGGTGNPRPPSGAKPNADARPGSESTGQAMPLDAYIRQRAAALGINPSLAVALSRQENPYQTPDLRSRAGAVGIMQLMPSTFTDQGYKLSQISQVAPNIEAGLTYLKKQLDTFGSTALALAAYNAGPGAVQKAGGIPHIQETENYVHEILRMAGLPDVSTGGGGGARSESRAPANPANTNTDVNPHIGGEGDAAAQRKAFELEFQQIVNKGNQDRLKGVKQWQESEISALRSVENETGITAQEREQIEHQITTLQISEAADLKKAQAEATRQAIADLEQRGKAGQITVAQEIAGLQQIADKETTTHDVRVRLLNEITELRKHDVAAIISDFELQVALINKVGDAGRVEAESLEGDILTRLNKMLTAGGQSSDDRKATQRAIIQVTNTARSNYLADYQEAVDAINQATEDRNKDITSNDHISKSQQDREQLANVQQQIVAVRELEEAYTAMGDRGATAVQAADKALQGLHKTEHGFADAILKDSADEAKAQDAAWQKWTDSAAAHLEKMFDSGKKGFQGLADAFKAALHDMEAALLKSVLAKVLFGMDSHFNIGDVLETSLFGSSMPKDPRTGATITGPATYNPSGGLFSGLGLAKLGGAGATGAGRIPTGAPTDPVTVTLDPFTSGAAARGGPLGALAGLAGDGSSGGAIAAAAAAAAAAGGIAGNGATLAAAATPGAGSSHDAETSSVLTQVPALAQLDPSLVAQLSASVKAPKASPFQGISTGLAIGGFAGSLTGGNSLMATLLGGAAGLLKVGNPLLGFGIDAAAGLIGSAFGPHWGPATNYPDRSDTGNYGQFLADWQGTNGVGVNGQNFNAQQQYNTSQGSLSLSQQMEYWAQRTAGSPGETDAQKALVAQITALDANNPATNLGVTSEHNGVLTLGNGQTISVVDAEAMQQNFLANGSNVTGGPIPIFKFQRGMPDFNQGQLIANGMFDPVTGESTNNGLPNVAANTRSALPGPQAASVNVQVDARGAYFGGIGGIDDLTAAISQSMRNSMVGQKLTSTAILA